jgi:hypothetical protein
VLFGAAVASGAGGQVALLVTADQAAAADTLLQPGQDARVDGDKELPAPPTWGSGGFTIGEAASLSVSYLPGPTTTPPPPHKQRHAVHQPTGLSLSISCHQVPCRAALA